MRMSAADAGMRRIEHNIGGAGRSLLDDFDKKQMDQEILKDRAHAWTEEGSNDAKEKRQGPLFSDRPYIESTLD